MTPPLHLTPRLSCTGGVLVFTPSPQSLGFVMHVLFGYYGRLYRWAQSCLSGAADDGNQSNNKQMTSRLAICSDDAVVQNLGMSDTYGEG
mmetsp:Transcript_35962/g.113003  ORF Transcript_35962/g.113003 Transcript_35962/m.113003 type:complete len:90 (-) Transcript_35962:583-852(-)